MMIIIINVFVLNISQETLVHDENRNDGILHEGDGDNDNGVSDNDQL